MLDLRAALNENCEKMTVQAMSHSVTSHSTADLKNSIYDGMFANVFATLTGGVFLTGFLLFLNMNEFMIGLIASMPFLATVFQLPISYVIRKNGRRKRIAFWGAALARILWLSILFVVVLPLSAVTKVTLIMVLIFFSYTCASVSYVSWLSWITDLVPECIRGRFFGTRNMLNGMAGIIFLVIFGKILDTLQDRVWGPLHLGFGITFIIAVLFGLASLVFVNRISEPQDSESATGPLSSNRQEAHPFHEVNFRKFVTFAFFWNFSVYFASPFFTLYFLRELHFTYGFVAAMGMASALADIIGMRIWGLIADRVKNKGVIQLAGWIAIFLPLAWVSVRPESTFLAIILHVIGGGFWAGITLCTNNLLLKIAPREDRAVFFSIHNIIAGIGAALGPILAGYLLKHMNGMSFQLFSWTILPIQTIFITSTVLRLVSFRLFKYIDEPEAIPVGQIIRVLRSIRGLNMATGFNYILHPFIEISPKERE